MNPPTPQLQHVKGVTHAKQSVMLDGMWFENCTFTECTIIYCGGPCRTSSCTFSPNTLWDFRNQAAEVILALQQAGWHLGFGKPGKDCGTIQLKDHPTLQ